MKMRSAILFLGLFIFMSSCTREYICQCSIKYSGATPGLPDSTMVEFKIRDTRKEAIKKCSDNSITTTKDGVTMTEFCELY